MPKHPAPAERLDERLGVLLDVEQRLARQVAEAEGEARRRVAEARADGERVAEAARQREAEQAALDERAVRQAHASALDTLAAEHQRTLTRLRAVTDGAIERLARQALARAVGGEGEG